MKRMKLASALNIIGLATAFTACYVLWTQVRFATQYNRCFPEYEKIYRIELKGLLTQEFAAWTTRGAMDKIKEMPQVELSAVIGKEAANTLWRNGEELVVIEGWMVNNDAMECFKPKMVCGTCRFKGEGEVLLPVSLAQKIFGETNVAGKHFKTAGGGELTVVGVFEDYPENCFMKNVMLQNIHDLDKDDFEGWRYQGFVKMNDTTDLKALSRKMFWRAYNIPEDDKELQEGYAKSLEGQDLCLRPLAETYGSGVEETDKGNPLMVLIIQIASLLVLIVAAINFANFTLARTPMQIKAVNTKKVLGMSNSKLRVDMIASTMSTSLVALLLAIVFIHLLSLSPWIQGMIVGTIAVQSNIHIIIATAIIALAIGIIAGIYPAFYATSFPPALILKGSFGLSPRGVVMRKSLVTVQLFIAFTMTIFLGVLFLQSDFIYNSDYGYDKDEIVYCNHIARKGNMEELRSQLEAIPGVESIGFSQGIPGVSDHIMRWGRPRSDGKYQVNYTVISCDWNYLRTMGIDIVEGHDFGKRDSDCYIFNQTARKHFDWMELDKPVVGDGIPVIGICKNFRIFSARQDNSEIDCAFIVFGETFKDWNQPYQIVARIGKNVDKPTVMKKMHEALAKNFPSGYPVPEFRFIDDELQQTYEEEFRFIRQVEAFSLICLLITLVGVFCLTMFETEYRRKEIGLRKIMGNSTRDIILMFCRRYAALIIVAFVLAAPLAWYMAEQWLRNFAERTPIHFWLWPAGFTAVSLVVLFTISAQTWRTARENPVNSIKQE